MFSDSNQFLVILIWSGELASILLMWYGYNLFQMKSYLLEV